MSRWKGLRSELIQLLDACHQGDFMCEGECRSSPVLIWKLVSLCWLLLHRRRTDDDPSLLLITQASGRFLRHPDDVLGVAVMSHVYGNSEKHRKRVLQLCIAVNTHFKSMKLPLIKPEYSVCSLEVSVLPCEDITVRNKPFSSHFEENIHVDSTTSTYFHLNMSK